MSLRGRVPFRPSRAPLATGLALSSACLTALLSGACGLDDRALKSTDNAGGERSGPQHGDGGSTYVPSDGGAGNGPGGPGPVEIPICDYSTDVASECETLAKNAGFAKDVASWDPDGGVYGLWREDDASESKGSGSIDVLNTLSGTDDGVAPGSARQCLPAKPGNAYDLASDVFIEDGQGAGVEPGAPYEGSAILGAFFFDGEECQGTSVGFINAEPVSKTDEWVHVDATGVAPELTRSISVRLNALKPIRETTFKATFDNVFVRERTP